MTRTKLILALLLLASLLPILVLAAPDEASGTATNVVDGDTFDLIEKTRPWIIYEIERVRPADVDSPEVSAPEGELADVLAAIEILGQGVWLDMEGQGPEPERTLDPADAQIVIPSLYEIKFGGYRISLPYPLASDVVCNLENFVWPSWRQNWREMHMLLRCDNVTTIRLSLRINEFPGPEARPYTGYTQSAGSLLGTNLTNVSTLVMDDGRIALMAETEYPERFVAAWGLGQDWTDEWILSGWHLTDTDFVQAAITPWLGPKLTRDDMEQVIASISVEKIEGN